MLSRNRKLGINLRSMAACSILASLTVLTTASSAHAQVVYKAIATTATGSGFTAFGSAPTISSNGNIAFTATITGGAMTIFQSLAGGTATATLATTASGSSFTNLSTADINNSGTIVFDGTTSAGTGTYLVSSTGTISAISTTISGSLAINFAGTVAIGVGTQIYTSTSRGSPVLINTNGTHLFDYKSAPAIDGNGSVYFGASIEGDLSAGVYRDNGQTTTSGFESGNNYQANDQFSSVAVNSTGTIAYYAPADYYGTHNTGDTPYAKSGLYFSSLAHPIAYLSTYGGVYKSFGAIAINNQNDFAFYGTTTNGNAGIYIGNFGNYTQKLIAVGDAFDGSTISSLVFTRDGLGDAFGTPGAPLAFEATLTDGRSGIYTATIPQGTFTAPEPGTFALALPEAVLLFAFCGTRKKRATR